MNCTKTILFLSALGLASCTEAPQPDFVFENHTGYSAYALVGSAATYGADSDMEYVDSASLIMPMRIAGRDVAELRDSILSYSLGLKGMPTPEAIEKWMETTAKEQNEGDVKKIENLTESIYGYDFVEGFVTNLDSEMLVYCVRKQGYAAMAAHGLTTRRYINYHFADGGKIITLEDIFTPSGLKALPDRIAEQAQSLSDVIGDTQISGLPSYNNYYISSNGEIVFSYQPYEVASYAQGTIDIPFYPYELAPLMTPAGIALFHLEDLE